MEMFVEATTDESTPSGTRVVFVFKAISMISAQLKHHNTLLRKCLSISNSSQLNIYNSQPDDIY